MILGGVGEVCDSAPVLLSQALTRGSGFLVTPSHLWYSPRSDLSGSATLLLCNHFTTRTVPTSLRPTQTVPVLNQ